MGLTGALTLKANNPHSIYRIFTETILILLSLG